MLAPRINTIKHNGQITMSLFTNAYQGNAVKEHVGFVALRASLAARKPNCELIMGLVTQTPEGAEVSARKGRGSSVSHER